MFVFSFIVDLILATLFLILSQKGQKFLKFLAFIQIKYYFNNSETGSKTIFSMSER